MFTSLSDKLQKYLLPIANKIGENRYLQAVKNAFLVSLPFTMFGSLILALANIPYMEKILGADALAAFQNAIVPIPSTIIMVIRLNVTF